MDDDIAAAARRRKGVVLTTSLGGHPGRSARRAGLVPLRPGAFVATTQPVDVLVALEGLRSTATGRDWVVLGEAALWVYGLAAEPSTLSIGVPHGHKLSVRAPAAVRRVASSVLSGSRGVNGCRLVALEVAVIQVAAKRSRADLRDLVEDLVRGRHTTIARLRARCRRGLKGSAAVRRVCDDLAGGSMEADVRRLRAALIARGVVGLEPEVHFTNARGASAYADLLHRPTMTVLEVDGMVEHSRRNQFRADRRRDRWMKREHGATTLRIDVLEIREDLDAVADEVAWFLLPAQSEVA